MRLLEYKNDSEFRLTKDFISGKIPEYAILSHTWGVDTEEVNYRDLIDGTGENKVGYTKIRFCGEQARRDGLHYFWVDTCCIDKCNAVELQEAINSMFRWYRNAVKCYVYLSNVSTKKRKASDSFTEYTWELAFRSSRWFSRGWTLQELLAPGPGSVEFFSVEGIHLGDKESLGQLICEITNIPLSALRGTPLSQFSVEDRLLWAESRQTTREEDKIYSLFGIFDIQMPLLYGEGREKAFKRLREEIDKLSKEEKFVLDRLRFVDNAAFDSHDEEHNARCYQGTRVELLRQIDTWASDRASESIFWLNGMAGTGKSTISRTVAQNFAEKGDLGASFFFKRGGGDRGHAGFFIATIAVQLAQKFPALVPYVRSAIEADLMISRKALKQQFDTLILHPLSKVQTDRPTSSRIVIVIDALDECDREEDIRIIIRLLSQAQRIASIQLKFFLTSRPELPMRLGFEDIRGKHSGLILQQVPEAIVKEDISAFLEFELAKIRDDYHKSVKSSRRQLPDDWPGQNNVQILVEMAYPLFIFAATVCRFINDRRLGQPNQQLTKVLKYQTKSQASKFDATYLPVLNQLVIGVTGLEKRDIVEQFKQVVGSIVVLASPLSATSLDQLLGVPQGTVDDRTDLLHSVLSIPSDPNHPIQLLHLSFREFLVDTERSETNPFWVDENQTHQMIANCCIRLMSSSLKQNICCLEPPGILKTEVPDSRVDQYLPPEVKYACLYWIQHLQKSSTHLDDYGTAYQFFQEHFIHWLEALGWMGKALEGIQAIVSLEAYILVNKSPNLYAFIHDAKRFALYNRTVIDQSPLQLYCSALIFAPETSIVRRKFKKDIPPWIERIPTVQENWNAALQTLEGHLDWVTSVAFSSDGKQVVSGSSDKTVRLWDTVTGVALHTLEGHSDSVDSVAFSPDSKQVISGSQDRTVRLWDTATGTLQQTLAHSDPIISVVFSPDGKQVISYSSDETVWLWDAVTGVVVQTLEGHLDAVEPIAFSPDSKQIVSGSDDWKVRIWDAITGALQQTLQGHLNVVTAVAFSLDSKQVVSGSTDKTVRLWDAVTGAVLQMLQGHSGSVFSVAFSPNGKQVVSSSSDLTVRLWDAVTGVVLQILKGHLDLVVSVAFSRDGKQVVSCSYDRTVRLWDAVIGTTIHMPEDHSVPIISVAFSPNGKHVVSCSSDKKVRLWDAVTGAVLQTLKGHLGSVFSVAFSPNSKQVVSGSSDKTVRLWDVATGAALHTLEGHSDSVKSVAFSPNGKQVVSCSFDRTVRLWDANTKEVLQTLKGHLDLVVSVAFSLNSKQVVSGSSDKTVKLWDAVTGAVIQTLNGHLGSVFSVAISPDSKQVVSGSQDRTVRLWDASTGALRHTLEGHSNPVFSVVFSSDNKQVVSSSEDKTVRLWDTVTGAMLQTLEGLSDSVKSITFSADGKLLPALLIPNSWVVEEGIKLIWLPPDYRPRCIAIWNKSLVLGYSSRRVSIIGFKEGSKFV